MHSGVGNDIAFELMRKIAFREGIGDLLADGVYEAARRIGKGAEQHEYSIKKLEMWFVIPQWTYGAFVSAVGDKDLTRAAQYVPQHLFGKSEQFKKEYMDSIWWPYPEEWKKWGMAPYDPTGGDWERLATMAAWDRDRITASDCTGICTFWSGFSVYPPIQVWDEAALVSYSTGVDVDQEEIMRIGRRTGLLFKAYNVILGQRKKDDS